MTLTIEPAVMVPLSDFISCFRYCIVLILLAGNSGLGMNMLLPFLKEGEFTVAYLIHFSRCDSANIMHFNSFDESVPGAQ